MARHYVEMREAAKRRIEILRSGPTLAAADRQADFIEEFLASADRFIGDAQASENEVGYGRGLREGQRKGYDTGYREGYSHGYDIGRIES